MKKIMIVSLVILLPLMAKAQPVDNQIIQAATADLKPAFCAGEIQQAIKIVKDCYKKVDLDSQKNSIDKCILEDFTVITVIKQKQIQARQNNQPDPYIDLNFIQVSEVDARFTKYPNFASKIAQSDKVKETLTNAALSTREKLAQQGCFDINAIH